MSSRALRVSVVLATHNGEHVLLEQLESIAAQSLLPLELIVGDDCSSDRTLEIMREFEARAPFAVRVTRNDERFGYSENFLRMLQQTRGDLVAFCDQDDVWFPEKLKACVPHFHRTNVMALVHDGRIVDEELRPLDSRYHSGLLRKLLTADPLHVPHGSHMIFRSHLIRDVPIPGRPVSVYGWHAQEHDEWASFAATALGRIKVIRRPLISYRPHEGAVGFQNGQQTRGQLLRPDERRETRLAAAIARSEYLEALAKDATGEKRDRLARSAESYRRLARNLDWQMRVYEQEPGTPRRLRQVTVGLLKGSYRGFQAGGLGSMALVRDTRGTKELDAG